MSQNNQGGPAFYCRRCGNEIIPKAEWQRRDRRCLPCKRVQQNALNLQKGERLRVEGRAAYRRRIDYYKNYWQEARQDPFHILKRSARRKVATEIEAGRLNRQPCRHCGAVKADAHHRDYTKPLEIEWLCRRCHFAEERKAA